ncbi:MAG: LamG domain-containing protein [Spirochaetia bacterium]|nr:LamG domain-containing protein [Spirochaetia bacterium]
MKIVCIICFLLGCGACSFKPQEHPLDPTTAQGLILSLLGASTEQLPVSGAGLWLRADDAFNQNSLTIWPDRTANGSAIAGPLIPVEGNQVNGKPAVNFPGSSPYRLNGVASQLISNTFSVLAVFRNGTSAPTGVNQALINVGPGVGGVEYALDGASEQLLLLKSNVLPMFVGVSPLTNTTPYRITTLTYDTSGNGIIYLNGATEVSGTNLQTFTNSGQITIGSRTDDTEYFKGHIAEVIVFTRSLSVSDRQSLECYLSKRYAISVSFACP